MERRKAMVKQAQTEHEIARARSRRLSRRTWLVRSGTAVLVLVVLAALWQWIIWWRRVPVYVVPGPIDVFGGLKDNWQPLVSNMGTTALEAAAGFAVGTVVACLLAVSFLYLPPIRAGLMPVAIAVSTVPLVAIAPILILIFGQGLLSKVVMTSMICFFPTLVNLVRGLEAVDQETLDLFHVHNATRLQILAKLRLPTARPYLFAALRVTSTAAVIGAIVAEWVNSERGLGFIIIQETFNFDAVLLWAAMLMAITLATAFFLVVVVLDKLSSRYVVH